jgi:hypothetical protein
MKKLLFYMVFFASFVANAQNTALNPGLKLTFNGRNIATIGAGYGAVLDVNKPFCGELVLVNSKGVTAQNKLEACDTVLNTADMKGKIALISRGVCNFNIKVENAQRAGAIAVIMYDNVANATLTLMTGTFPNVTVPFCRISLEDGNAISAELKAGKTVNVCMTAPQFVVDQVYGNRYVVTSPLSQTDTVYQLMSCLNRGDSLKKVQITADITSPSGKVTTLKSVAEDVEPTPTGFISLLGINSGYVVKEKGTHKVRFTNNVTRDTNNTTFIISDYTFSNDIGTLTGTGTSRTPATFATQGKKYSHLNFYFTDKKATKATFATFGIINAAAMKNRSFTITLWETNEEKLDAISNSLSNIGDIAEFPIGDEVIYKMAGTEKSLITVPLKQDNNKFIDLEANKIYILSVEYNGSGYTDSIVPQYTLGRTLPVRWAGLSVFGTGVMSGDRYFGGGWNATEDPVGRLHIDGFVGNEDLAYLEESEVKIFPNPTSDIVNVQLNLNDTPKKVELGIMDINGAILRIIPLEGQQDLKTISIGDYPAGTYFFTVKTDKAFSTQMVVKQ